MEIGRKVARRAGRLRDAMFLKCPRRKDSRLRARNIVDRDDIVFIKKQILHFLKSAFAVWGRALRA